MRQSRSSEIERVAFFPYEAQTEFDAVRCELEASDVAIFVAPALRRRWARTLSEHGVRVLAYISLLKAPSVTQLAPGTRFRGGAPSLEEVSANPYWQAIQLGQALHDVAVDEAERWRVPFDSKRSSYKEGWFQPCLFANDFGNRVRIGARSLLDLGFDGLFIDNVVAHDVCHHHACPGRRRAPARAQAQALRSLYELVKRRDPSGLVVVNAGRSFLTAPLQVADIVVTENFAFGDSIDETRGLFLAGHYHRDRSSFVAEGRAIQHRLDSLGMRLLGYTKVNRKMTTAQIDERLAVARDLAAACGILWTTRLQRYGHGGSCR